MKDNLAVVCAQIDKKYGKGSVMRLTDKVDVSPNQVISTGSIQLDAALGIGGYKKGRIVEIYGQESCIYSESYLAYEVVDKDGTSINHKGGSIARLYERFHNTRVEGTPNQGCHLYTHKEDIEYFIRSANDEGSIIRNKVLDVVKTGEKECFEVTTEHGNKLTTTAEHKFLTPDGYRPLSELEVGSTLFVHNNTRNTGRKYYQSRSSVMVKYHPCWPTKVVSCKKTNRDYLYYRGQKSRAVYEAFLNDMKLEEYLDALNTLTKNEINQLFFIPKDIHVHHLDEDFNNNDISNLKLIDPSEHGKLHAGDRHRNLSFIAVESKVISIESVGLKETYDLKCAFPYNNYIAEGIVVHNSGKTTLCLHAVANAQKMGKTCVYIDAEHSLDPTYAQCLGVNLDELIISQPDYGEQALDIVDSFVRSGEIGLIVVDSVAALIPQKELEGEVGDSVVGLQARIMSQAMRKITGVTSKTECSVIFVNQIRMKIGVMWGSPNTTTGGNALKFYASQRLEIIRIGDVKKSDKIIGNRTKVKVVKNKLAPPKKEVEFDILFGVGIDEYNEVIDLAVSDGLILKTGAWYKHLDGVSFAQGLPNAIEWMKEHREEFKKLKKQILENRGLDEEPEEEKIDDKHITDNGDTELREEPKDS